jgi:hypothetical protein
MAPLATNLSRRTYFDYVTSSTALVAQNHTAMWRTAFDTADPGAVNTQTKFLAFLNQYGTSGFWAGWQITGVRVSEGNQTFSVPVPLTAGLGAFVGTSSTAAAIVSSAAIEAVFVGRSPLTGRRSRFSIYGRAFINVGDFRDSASGPTLGAVAELNDETPILLVALDNTRATWSQYNNYNYNSYWESALRT